MTPEQKVKAKYPDAEYKPFKDGSGIIYSYTPNPDPTDTWALGGGSNESEAWQNAADKMGKNIEQ